MIKDGYVVFKPPSLAAIQRIISLSHSRGDGPFFKESTLDNHISLSPEITSWNKLHHHWDDSLRWGLEIHIFISRDDSLELTYQSPEMIPWIPYILEFHSSISGVVTIVDGLNSTYPSPEIREDLLFLGWGWATPSGNPYNSRESPYWRKRFFTCPFILPKDSEKSTIENFSPPLQDALKIFRPPFTGRWKFFIPPIGCRPPRWGIMNLPLNKTLKMLLR